MRNVMIACLLVAAGACSDSDTRIEAGQSSAGSSALENETSGQPLETVPATEGDSSASTQPELPLSSLVEIDVAALVDTNDVAELTQISGPILLPTLVPAWAADAEFHLSTNAPALDNYVLKWAVYSDDPVAADVLHFDLGRADPKIDYELPRGGTKEGSARVYSLIESDGEPCDGTGGEGVLAWEDGGYRFDLAMFPRPDCPGADADALDQAIAIADSMRAYRIVDGALVLADA